MLLTSINSYHCNMKAIAFCIVLTVVSQLFSQNESETGIDFGWGYSKIIFPGQAKYMDMFSDSLGLSRSFSKYSGFRDALVGFTRKSKHFHFSMALQGGWHLDDQKSAQSKYSIVQKNLYYQLGFGYYLNKYLGVIGDFCLYNARYNWGAQNGSVFNNGWEGGFGKGPSENIRTMAGRVKLNIELPVKNRYKPNSYFVIAPYWIHSLNKLKYYDLLPLRLTTYNESRKTAFSGWGVNVSYRLPVSGS